MRVFSLILLHLFILASCHFPADPESTLNQVKNHVLHVGIAQGARPQERELIQEFAQSLHAEVEWHRGNLEDLYQDLEHYKVSVVIGGITDETPWKKRIGLTRPYEKDGKTKYVMAVPQGENGFLVELETFLHRKTK